MNTSSLARSGIAAPLDMRIATTRKRPARRHPGVVTSIVDPYPSLARKLELLLILNGRAQASVAAAQQRRGTDHHSHFDDVLLARHHPG